MQMGEGWLRTWICLSLLFAWASAARPRFDVSTDMGMVLVPADAEPETAIFRLRATDQDADFPLVFEIIATTSPIVRVENLPCTLYNKVCQANVILTRRLVAGRLHDFVVRVRDSKGDVNSMQATISVTNTTTPRDKIFPHVPSLIMVPEDTKPEKELDYLLVESNPWSGKPVYIELWQPKELFKIRQRQMGSQTKGIITLIGELDFETQSMYTLTMYATDPYTEPGKDTRNIAGLHIVVIVQDVQDVPPVFTLAPPLTKINNTVKPGDVILRVHAEDGDKGVPREVTYGLISEGNPFTPFFNVSETTGEIILAKPLEELTKITHVGAPIVLKIVAEEIRTMRDEPPAQATVVELGLLLGEPGNSPPYFENDNYVAWMDENAEPGTIVVFTDVYSTRVRDEDIGKAGVFALKLDNNNGTFEISPAVAERTANFVITVRDNALIDYEKFRSLRFRIIAQEVGPATNLSASVPVTIFLRDLNDNPPIFDVPIYEVTLSEKANAGTRVVQVHATDLDAGIFGRIQYTKIVGVGSEAFEMNPDTGLITVSMGSVLDREQTAKLELTVEARDEDGRGQRGIATLIVNILDVNDNSPIFEKGIYEFLLNSELTNFTMPAFIKAVDADAEPPNNEVRYEIVHGNYENKFILNEESGELTLREPINKARKVRQTQHTLNLRKQFRAANLEILKNETNATDTTNTTLPLNYQNVTDLITNSTFNDLNTTDTNSNFNSSTFQDFHLFNNLTEPDVDSKNQSRRRRAEDTPLFILTARAYDLGVPHLSSIAQIRIMRPMSAFARIVMFVMPGENPDPTKTAETLATITGSRVIIQEIKPYISQIEAGSGSDLGKRSVVVAKVEQNGPGTLVDVDKIRESLAANGFGILSGMDGVMHEGPASPGIANDPRVSNSETTNVKNITVLNSSNEEVTVYKAENKLLTWLLVLLGLLLLAAIITLIVCCICPSCPFYMEPRKRRIHSSETLIIRSDGRPKRHLHRKPIKVIDGYHAERKEAWSADPARQHWQFNRRNTKNAGIASLPGDIVPGHQNSEIQRLRRVASLRQDGNTLEPGVFGEHVIHPPRIIPMPMADDRMYMEDVEASRQYDQAELDSLRRHEMERGSDGGRHEPPMPGQEPMREQHFYRDGNAEVLRLVTRGEIEDHREYSNRMKDLYHANGKDILLQRFIEDQKLRRSQDLRGSFHESLHEADVDRSMESHRRINGPAEIIIIPEILEVQRQPSYDQRQQQSEMMNAEVQRVVIERNYESKDDGDEYAGRVRASNLRASMRDIGIAAGELDDASVRDRAAYGMHDAELVRQNALLTRLLLEKEGRGLTVPVVDSSSFLETQSLPGQVAIATQTDRTAATQTDFFARSRSDNEESEEDPRMRRKSKLKGRIDTREDFKKMKTIWVRTPIPEESRVQSGTKKATPTRTKIEVSESRKISISPDVLKEISNSLKSGESGGNDEEEEEEEDEVLEEVTEAKPDKIQKTHKVMTKSVSTSKKKVKESKVNDDSTTPSPEMKEKKPLMKPKIRKKPEKPPRKKLEKSDSDKGHFMEPSFRILEKEMSSFQQKIRQFGDKKLKMLKKDDSSKKDKESEDDEGTTYDVSKKCEVTVTKTKKSVSRDTSPTKISVEQKRTSEEESSTRDKKNASKQQQPNISSSDFEDFDRPKRQPSNFSERTVQSETSKTQMRSHSKLRKQTHLDNSDTAKSSSEKNEKSEDSESKTDKSKDIPSSAEIKIESTSSSSRDLDKQPKHIESEKTQKSQIQEKKTLQSQRVTKVRPSRMIDIKRKVTSLKSKSIDEPIKKTTKKDEKVDKTKSLTSDESKLTSPSKSRESVYNKKSATSEEEKSKPSIKESMSIDFDKLVKDVRGVVEKEISSFTKAAKDALHINKSDSSDSDKKLRKQSSTKSKEVRKSQSIVDLKSPSQSSSTSKQGIDSSKLAEKEKMSKPVETKEKREKLKEQRSKSKSTESSSSTKVKSDDAISFIVIENKKSISEMTELSKKSQESMESTKAEKSENETSRDSQKSKSKENLLPSNSNEKIFDEEKASERINKTAKPVSHNIDQIKKDIINTSNDTSTTLSKNIEENIQTVSNKTNEIRKDVSAKVDGVEKRISDEVIKTETNLTDTINTAMKETVHQIDENKKGISDSIQKTGDFVTAEVKDANEVVSGRMHETAKKVSDGIDKADKFISDKVGGTQEVVSDKIDETTKKVSDGIDKADKFISDKVEGTQEVVSGKIDETAKNVSDGIDKAEKFVADKVGGIQEVVSDKIDKTAKNVSDGIDKAEKFVSDNVGDVKEAVSDQFNETANNVSDGIDNAEKFVSDKVGGTQEVVSDKIDKTAKNVSDGIDKAEKFVADKVEGTQEVVSGKIDETAKNVSDGIDKAEKFVADKVGGTQEVVSDKIDKTAKSVSDGIDNAEKFVSDKVGGTQKVVSDKIDKTAKNVSDGIDKAEKFVSDNVGDVKEAVSDQFNETANNVSDGIDKADKFVSDKVGDAKDAVTEKLIQTAEKVSNEVEDTSRTVWDEIHDTKNSISSGFKDAMKTVSDKVGDGMKSMGDKISGAKNVITDKVEEFIKDTAEVADETGKTVSSNVDEVKKTVSDGIGVSSKAVSDTVKDGNAAASNVVDEVNKNTTNIIDETKKGISDTINDGKQTVSSTIDKSIKKAEEILKVNNVEENGQDKIRKTSLPDTSKSETSISSNIDETKENAMKEVEHAVPKDNLSKSTSTSLPSETKNDDDKKATESHDKEMEIKPQAEPVLTIDSKKVKEMTKELLEIEHMNGDGIVPQTQKPKEESTSTTSNGTAKEKPKTTVTTQLKQTDKHLSKDSSVSSSDANKSKDVSPKESTTKKPEKQKSDKTDAPAPATTASPKPAPTSKPAPPSNAKLKPPGSPVKLMKPIVTITDATTGNEDSSDDDTSSASDISNKTALRTRPYSTPRHSISSDGGVGDNAEEEITPATKPPRQRWSSEKGPLLGVDGTRELAKAVFPQKIEVTPIDKPKAAVGSAAEMRDNLPSESHSDFDDATSTSSMQTDAKPPEVPDTKSRTEPTPRARPVVVAMRRKEHLRTDHFSRLTETRKSSPRREKPDATKKPDDSRNGKSTSTTTTTTTSEQRKVEIRSRHLKLHVSHHMGQRQPKDESESSPAKISHAKSPTREKAEGDAQAAGTSEGKKVIDYGKDPEIAKARSRYMAWYQQKRSEMERKRKEKKEAEEEQQKPKWLRRAAQAGKSRKAKSAEDGDKSAGDAKSSRSRERAKSSSEAQSSGTPGATRVNRLRIRPLVNVESEQLKAIVRQGRKLRRKQGPREEDPPVQIFVPDGPPPSDERCMAEALQLEPRHHLTQHSEYKYEKEVVVPPVPFFLHPPPPVPHPSPEHFQDDSSDSRRHDDDLDSGIAVSLQGGTRLRNQQLLEKKSVFDIAYSEASPTQLRSDSSTPPS